jgi:hypothetical protein
MDNGKFKIQTRNRSRLYNQAVCEYVIRYTQQNQSVIHSKLRGPQLSIPCRCFCSHEYASLDGCARDAKTTLGPQELLIQHVQGSGHRRQHVLEPALPCHSQQTHNGIICKADQSQTSSGHHIDTLPIEKMQYLLNHENKCLYIANIWPSLLYFDLHLSYCPTTRRKSEMGEKRGSGVVWGHVNISVHKGAAISWGTLTLVCTRGLPSVGHINLSVHQGAAISWGT